MKLRIAVALSILIALSSVFIPVGNASAYFTYVSYITGSDSQLTNIYGANISAQSFTTGAISVPLSYVQVYLFREGTPGNISLYIIETDNLGKPSGSALTISTVNGNSLGTSSVGQLVRFNISPVVLEKNMQYAVVLYAADGSDGNEINWKVDSSSPTYSGGTVVTSIDGGSTWTVDDTKDAMFSIVGDPITQSITEVAAFQNTFELGDVLWVVTYDINYAISPHESPENLYSIMLLGKSDRKLIRFGVSVTSIYMPASSSPPWRSIETIWIEGNNDYFGVGGVRATFTVEDWNYVSSSTVAEGRYNLFQYIMNRADYLETTYNTTYTFASYQWGNILNTQGCILFEKAIPGLGSIFPYVGYYLGQVAGVSFDYNYSTTQNTSYQNTLNTMLGTKTEGAFTGLATYLSVPGGFLKGLFALILYAIIVSIIFLTSGNSIAALILAIPVLCYCAYIGMIPLGIIFIVTFLAFMGMAYFLWLH